MSQTWKPDTCDCIIDYDIDKSTSITSNEKTLNKCKLHKNEPDGKVVIVPRPVTVVVTPISRFCVIVF